jgi:hypothetical protein
MIDLEGLFSEIERLHSWEACSSPSGIAALEKHLGYPIPDDMQAFYRRYGTVKLFVGEHGDAVYRFVPTLEIHRTRQDVYGIDTDEWGPSTWLTICDVRDGNYIAMDVASGDGNERNYIDAFHETFAVPGACKVIARTFAELLERALHGPETGLYFLQEDFVGYGDALEPTPETAIERIDLPDDTKSSWFVRFWHAGVPHRASFRDSDYGGREGAYMKAKDYLERNSM